MIGLQYKKCPSCGQNNKPEDFLCFNCMSDLTNVPVKERAPQSSDYNKSSNLLNDDNNITTIEKKDKNLLLKKIDDENVVILIKEEMIIGRESIEILRDQKFVSRQHAKIYFKNNTFFVKDLGSTNGTYVNSEKLDPNKEYSLNNGDIISFSKSIKFQVMLDEL
ncbi:MAG: FHA domain-containing protein [Candidatus Calescibacterium sp.]|nr:FHA domain-containing protein [Candidatus Calescibacterium sp.]MDW8133232.1 FHA domain-containing protein [Candidatus Calescibacterium sp.]